MSKLESFNTPLTPGVHPSYVKNRNTSVPRSIFRIDGKVYSLKEVLAHTGLDETTFRKVFMDKRHNKSFSMQTLLDAAK